MHTQAQPPYTIAGRRSMLVEPIGGYEACPDPFTRSIACYRVSPSRPTCRHTSQAPTIQLKVWCGTSGSEANRNRRRIPLWLDLFLMPHLASQLWSRSEILLHVNRRETRHGAKSEAGKPKEQFHTREDAATSLSRDNRRAHHCTTWNGGTRRRIESPTP